MPVCFIAMFLGSGKLDEWINLTSKEGQAPKIRVPHPMTAMQYEGSKKRRRAAVGYLTCSVGDKVDAWIHDRLFSFFIMILQHRLQHRYIISRVIC